jgi:hypothetical protein
MCTIGAMNEYQERITNEGDWTYIWGRRMECGRIGRVNNRGEEMRDHIGRGLEEWSMSVTSKNTTAAQGHPSGPMSRNSKIRLDFLFLNFHFSTVKQISRIMFVADYHWQKSPVFHKFYRRMRPSPSKFAKTEKFGPGNEVVECLGEI